MVNIRLNIKFVLKSNESINFCKFINFCLKDYLNNVKKEVNF